MQNNWYKLAQEEKEENIENDIDFLLKDPWEPVDSSFILSIAYYKNSDILEIKMKNGKKYTFMGVPENIYEEFKAAPSKGKFFNEIIKKRFVQN